MKPFSFEDDAVRTATVLNAMTGQSWQTLDRSVVSPFGSNALFGVCVAAEGKETLLVRFETQVATREVRWALVLDRKPPAARTEGSVLELFAQRDARALLEGLKLSEFELPFQQPRLPQFRRDVPVKREPKRVWGFWFLRFIHIRFGI